MTTVPNGSWSMFSVPLDHKVKLGIKDFKEILGQLENQEQMEIKDFKDQLDLQ